MSKSYTRTLETLFDQAYERTRNTTESIMKDLPPTDSIDPELLKISNKSDFMKGYAVAMLHAMVSEIDKISKEFDVKEPENASELKTEFEIKYTKKLVHYFDIPH